MTSPPDCEAAAARGCADGAAAVLGDTGARTCVCREDSSETEFSAENARIL